VKVLLVSEFYPPALGGLELHVEALASALAARNHEVHVATLAPEARTSAEGVTVHVVASTLGAAGNYVDRNRPYHPPIADPRVSRGLARLLTSIGPDIIHAHGPMAASLPRRRRAPLVYTAHDYALVCVKRDLLNAADDICEGPALGRCLRCSAHHFGAARGTLMAAAHTRSPGSTGADAYIAVSDSVAAAIRPSVGEVRIIPTFVPDEAVGRDEHLDGLPDEPFVMFAGAPSHHKGLGVLLDLWRAPGGMPVPLVVAATDDRLTPPPGVVLLRLTRLQTMLAWRRATVAAVPSLWSDPCPTVAIEAMLAGTAVVASAVGGLPSLVPHERAGLCIPPGDPAALRESLAGLLADQARRERMGRYGQVWARQFLASRVVPRIEAIYEELVSRRSVGGVAGGGGSGGAYSAGGEVSVRTPMHAAARPSSTGTTAEGRR
jgi:glycosyltransferase involved in cell wall biosynthesis